MKTRTIIGLILLVLAPFSVSLNEPPRKLTLYEPIEYRNAQFKGYEILVEEAIVHNQITHQKVTVKDKTPASNTNTLCATRYIDKNMNLILAPWNIIIGHCTSKQGANLYDAYNQQFIDKAFDFAKQYGIQKLEKLQTRFVDNGDGAITPEKVDENQMNKQ